MNDAVFVCQPTLTAKLSRPPHLVNSCKRSSRFSRIRNSLKHVMQDGPITAFISSCGSRANSQKTSLCSQLRHRNTCLGP